MQPDGMRAFLSSFRKKPRDNLMTVAAAFRVFDADGSGALDVDEIKSIFTRPGGGSALSDEQAMEIIREFDVNQDGVLQFDEFAVMWGGLGCDAVRKLRPGHPRGRGRCANVLALAIERAR